MDYSKNIELAMSLGLQEVSDENAYNGKFYVKNGIIWIHNIEALKAKLRVKSDQELKTLNYDVDSYYKYVDYTNEMVDDEMKFIYSAITHEDGEPTYLNDGIWLYPDGSMRAR
jgi:hypothetical protein